MPTSPQAPSPSESFDASKLPDDALGSDYASYLNLIPKEERYKVCNFTLRLLASVRAGSLEDAAVLKAAAMMEAKVSICLTSLLKPVTNHVVYGTPKDNQ